MFTYMCLRYVFVYVCYVFMFTYMFTCLCVLRVYVHKLLCFISLAKTTKSGVNNLSFLSAEFLNRPSLLSGANLDSSENTQSYFQKETS